MVSLLKYSMMDNFKRNKIHSFYVEHITKVMFVGCYPLFDSHDVIKTLF